MAKSAARSSKGAKEGDGIRLVAQNRRARFDYHLEDTIEAGIQLVGTEVKSLRGGKGSLGESYVRIENGEAWLVGAHIPEYDFGNRNNHLPTRTRKLLLHRAELDRLEKKVKAQGVTLVPTRIYFRDGLAKVEVAIGRGKNVADKRQTAAARDAQRQIDRALKSRRH
jgi:SsrA-binding protein